MTFEEKVTQLRSLIEQTLYPLLKGKEVILLDIPFHINIGDTLIWEGTRQFIKRNRIRCIGEYPNDTYDFRELSSDIVILLSGGGNFGDIWPEYQEFRNKVIQKYTENNIIILPQSVWYENIEKLNRDSEVFNQHKKITICVRDITSFKILKNSFRNDIRLVPDMAFCIDALKIIKSRKKYNSKILFCKRLDKEINPSYNYSSIIPKDSEVHDWPTFDYNHSFFEGNLSKFINLIAFRKRNLFRNWYGIHIFRRNQIKKGVNFLSEYSQVYTTRLHIGILCILLGIPFTFLDNSYSKNLSFYVSWLIDVKKINFFPVR